MVTFLLSVHTITEAKQYTGLDRAKPGLEPGRWIFQPGHFTWCALDGQQLTNHTCHFEIELNKTSATASR